MAPVPVEPATSATAARGTDRRLWLGALFAAVLVFHLWAVTVGWTSRFLPGNEYRQTHTAISALFIQRDHDFSLAYPTPILGKPWSIPYEFPLYQWTVVGLSNLTGRPIIPCARALSVACFYLTLPAVWLLLGRIGLPGPRRLVVLGAILTSPLYIFYARAFLIETMALMFSVWFLYAYVTALERRHRGWLAAAAVCGLGAGGVKVTTFLLHLVPAAAWTAGWLWSVRREGREFIRRFAWGAAAVAVPFAGTLAWVRFADGVKVQNLDGRNFASGPMTPYHFGTWADRLSMEHWPVHFATVTKIVAGPVALAVLLGSILFWAGPVRRWIGAAIAVFALGPVVFPVLYAWHDYYFAANSLFLLGALGLGLGALLDSRLPRGLVALVFVVTLGSQAWGYLRDFYPTQRTHGAGGTGLSALLRDTTEPDDVLVIAGQDWSPILPFYAERRALMFRWLKDQDWSYVPGALDRIMDENVPALLLAKESRGNTPFRDDVAARFGLSTDPVATCGDVVLYVTPALRKRIIEQMHALPYGDVELSSRASAESAGLKSRVIPFAALPERQRQVYAAMAPAPRQVAADFPMDLVDLDGGRVLSAHPHSRLWFAVPAGRRTVEVEFGFLPAAHEGVHIDSSSDGVDFTVEVWGPQGRTRTVFHRRLDPQRVPGDRGRQRARFEVELGQGEELVLATGPGPAGLLTRDWAYWGGWRFE